MSLQRSALQPTLESAHATSMDGTQAKEELSSVIYFPFIRYTSVLSRLRAATRFTRTITRTKNIVLLSITGVAEAKCIVVMAVCVSVCLSD